jgi:hypothetical protein
MMVLEALIIDALKGRREKILYRINHLRALH